MTVKRSFGIFGSILSVILIGHLAAANAPSGAPEGDLIEVVCTTTFLSTITGALGGEYVETATILPYAMCPGHFDLSPAEARRLLDAQVVFRHGYEQFLKGISFDSDTRIFNMEVAGNWMIPQNHISGVASIAGVLANMLPGQADSIESRADAYTKAVRTAADSLYAALAGMRDVPVICAGMNSDFAEWAGLDVVTTFPRDEDMSVKMMRDIIDRGESEKIALVIDNMQSSGKVGRTIAENLGVPYVMMTNFPDPASVGIPYLATLSENCAALVEAIKDTGRLTLSEP